jgi:hypothetical protein
MTDTSSGRMVVEGVDLAILPGIGSIPPIGALERPSASHVGAGGGCDAWLLAIELQVGSLFGARRSTKFCLLRAATLSAFFAAARRRVP